MVCALTQSAWTYRQVIDEVLVVSRKWVQRFSGSIDASMVFINGTGLHVLGPTHHLYVSCGFSAYPQLHTAAVTVVICGPCDVLCIRTHETA